MTPSEKNQYADLKGKIGHVPQAFKDLAASSPEMHDAVLALDSFVWADGALSRKEKKLIAVSIAAALRDTHATRAQLMGAKNLGITLEEVDEALRVAFMLSGMPAYVQGKSAAEEIFKK
ncbi:MAG TPA: carboxymuconolactone decarboxylase family protein [Methanocorpusculum sp.]|nr:carboxymuconolactone decarboxylase family protein [Methanocorpusculum sp.]